MKNRDQKEAFVKEYLKIYKELQGIYQKPIATWLYGSRLSPIHEMANQLEEMSFPVFSDLEMAIKALGISSQYAMMKKGEKRWRRPHS